MIDSIGTIMRKMKGTPQMSIPTLDQGNNYCDVNSMHKEMILQMFLEMRTSMRSRSEAEYIYTASAMGCFGGLAWGVAALPHRVFSLSSSLPSITAFLGIIIISEAVIKKIVTDHEKFAAIKKEEARLASMLDRIEGLKGLVPRVTLDGNCGKGYKASVNIIRASAIASSLFCISTLFVMQ
jgi:hypothetical protein